VALGQIDPKASDYEMRQMVVQVGQMFENAAPTTADQAA